jgi:hypothetical protein
MLHLIWREKEGGRRTSTFVPFDPLQVNPDVLAALAESPRNTAYLYSEVEHMRSSQPLGGGEEKLREALAIAKKAIEQHGEWCGEKEHPVGLRRAEDAIDAALDSNPSPASKEALRTAAFEAKRLTAHIIGGDEVGEVWASRVNALLGQALRGEAVHDAA